MYIYVYRERAEWLVVFPREIPDLAASSDKWCHYDIYIDI